MGISRMAFLRGDFQGRVRTIRPPWALEESLFIEQCERCTECISHCPTKIIEKGRGGFPAINFHNGECDFCGDCVSHCKPGALQRDAMEGGLAPWSAKVSISDSCIAQKGVVCRSCGEQCDERAIRFRPQVGGLSLPEIDFSACTGCGACVAPCPVKAISVIPHADDTPDVTKSRLEETA